MPSLLQTNKVKQWKWTFQEKKSTVLALYTPSVSNDILKELAWTRMHFKSKFIKILSFRAEEKIDFEKKINEKLKIVILSDKN